MKQVFRYMLQAWNAKADPCEKLLQSQAAGWNYKQDDDNQKRVEAAFSYEMFDFTLKNVANSANVTAVNSIQSFPEDSQAVTIAAMKQTKKTMIRFWKNLLCGENDSSPYCLDSIVRTAIFNFDFYFWKKNASGNNVLICEAQYPDFQKRYPSISLRLSQKGLCATIFSYLVSINKYYFIHSQREKNIQEKNFVAPDNSLFFCLLIKPAGPLILDQLVLEPILFSHVRNYILGKEKKKNKNHQVHIYETYKDAKGKGWLQVEGKKHNAQTSDDSAIKSLNQCSNQKSNRDGWEQIKQHCKNSLKRSVVTGFPSVFWNSSSDYSSSSPYKLTYVFEEFVIQPLAGRSIAPHNGTYLNENCHSHKPFTRRKQAHRAPESYTFSLGSGNFQSQDWGRDSFLCCQIFSKYVALSDSFWFPNDGFILTKKPDKSPQTFLYAISASKHLDLLSAENTPKRGAGEKAQQTGDELSSRMCLLLLALNCPFYLWKECFINKLRHLTTWEKQNITVTNMLCGIYLKNWQSEENINAYSMDLNKNMKEMSVKKKKKKKPYAVNTEKGLSEFVFHKTNGSSTVLTVTRQQQSFSCAKITDATQILPRSVMILRYALLPGRRYWDIEKCLIYIEPWDITLQIKMKQITLEKNPETVKAFIEERTLKKSFKSPFCASWGKQKSEMQLFQVQDSNILVPFFLVYNPCNETCVNFEEGYILYTAIVSIFSKKWQDSRNSENSTEETHSHTLKPPKRPNGTLEHLLQSERAAIKKSHYKDFTKKKEKSSYQHSCSGGTVIIWDLFYFMLTNKSQISQNHRNKDSLKGTRNKRCSESRMKTKPQSAIDDVQNTLQNSCMCDFEIISSTYFLPLSIFLHGFFVFILDAYDKKISQENFKAIFLNCFYFGQRLILHFIFIDKRLLLKHLFHLLYEKEKRKKMNLETIARHIDSPLRRHVKEYDNVLYLLQITERLILICSVCCTKIHLRSSYTVQNRDIQPKKKYFKINDAISACMQDWQHYHAFLASWFVFGSTHFTSEFQLWTDTSYQRIKLAERVCFSWITTNALQPSGGVCLSFDYRSLQFSPAWMFSKQQPIT
ncbi:hypothetical protein IHE44_0005280 [Lamprotornis superbus]|uniref:Uncharacterized protein n=1 Tax=Lamprotornis superbus TaxID=245042 RepID=A0A835P1E7_9PASS|nr:hypothetical protein IHE44_0005280 [Lamprotornis superbus]